MGSVKATLRPGTAAPLAKVKLGSPEPARSSTQRQPSVAIRSCQSVQGVVPPIVTNSVTLSGRSVSVAEKSPPPPPASTLCQGPAAGS